MPGLELPGFRDNGSSSWTDTVDLHNVGQNASFNIVELAADGHTVHSWTGLVASGSVVPEQTLTLTQGDHATITINHFDGLCLISTSADPSAAIFDRPSSQVPQRSR